MMVPTARPLGAGSEMLLVVDDINSIFYLEMLEE